jgi:hypothetical protein
MNCLIGKSQWPYVSRCPDLPREVLFSVANFMCCVFFFRGGKNISRIVCASTRTTKYFLNDLRKCILAYTRIPTMKIDFPFLSVASHTKVWKSCFLIEHTRRGYFSSQPHLPRLIMEKAAHGVPFHYQLLLDREL